MRRVLFTVFLLIMTFQAYSQDKETIKKEGTSIITTGAFFDLESNTNFTSGMSREKFEVADLFFDQKNLDAVALGPWPNQPTRLSTINGSKYEDLNMRDIMQLAQDTIPYIHSSSRPVLVKGAVFALKTKEGNYAKLRVVDFDNKGAVGKTKLILEWCLYFP